MTQLNRIELIGYIGNIKVEEIAQTKIARLTVATNLCYKNRQNETVIETTWTYVTAFEGKNINLDGLQKGTPVHVIGRLRNQRYADCDGEVRYSTDVLASVMERIEQESVLMDTVA